MRKLILLSVLFFVLFLGLQTPVHAGFSVGIGFSERWHHDRGFAHGYVPLTDYYVARDYYSPYYPVTSYSYVVPFAPMGSVVYAIPAGCRQIFLNGVTYFEYNGVYYLPVAGGYQVVPPPFYAQPTAVLASPTVITLNADSTNAQEGFTVNVPNSQGGYTAVNIKRSGSGFIGPQGEFYSEFPKVPQLRAMYAK